MTKLYRVKSLKWTKNSGITTWWRDNDCGYTTDELEAGLYTEKQIQDQRSYYDNGVSTLAIPVDVEEWSEYRIEAYEGYLRHEKSNLSRWRSSEKQAAEALERAERMTEHCKQEIKKLTSDLLIQKALKTK